MSNRPIYPLGLRHSAYYGANFFRITFWPKQGSFECVGLRSFVEDNYFLLMSIHAGQVPCLIGGTVDAAAYNVGKHPVPAGCRASEGYWPFPMPAISKASPGLLRGSLLHSYSDYPCFNLAFYGRFSDGGCGPLEMKVETAEHPSEIEPCERCGKPSPYQPAYHGDRVPVCSDCG